MVAQRLPASRETVEKSAEAKASPNPTSDSRNFAQTSAFADCSHSATRPGVEDPDFNGLATAEPISFEASIPEQNGQSATDCRESVRNLRLSIAAIRSFENDDPEVIPSAAGGFGGMYALGFPGHSFRSATTGSTPAARRAGISDASSAAKASIKTASASLTGFHGLTPNS